MNKNQFFLIIVAGTSSRYTNENQIFLIFVKNTVAPKIKATLVNFTLSWYEFASYTIEEINDNFSKVYLHLDNFVTIQEEDYKESYAMIRGIF